ncbi:Fibronectin type 3 and ankyrin repeat domains protein 1, partial [Desmophyllum pertusum]
GSAATVKNAQRPPAATESQTSSSSNEQRSSGTSTNALSELRRRFPTLSRGRGASRDPVTGRFDRSHTSRPYSARRPAGRPLATEIVSKDVIILEFGREKIPTKSEKHELERSGRIISGFDINRKWDAKKATQRTIFFVTGEMEGMYFEIVKNSGGTLLRPNLPTGKDIDSKLLLKSIAPSGCVYLRLLEELPESMMDPSDKQLEVSPFTFEEGKSDILHQSDGNGGDDLFVDLSKPTHSSDSDVGVEFQHISDTNAKSSTNAGSVFTTHATGNSQSPLNLFDIQSIIRGAKNQGLSDPVEVLKFLQKEIVTGRALEVTSCEEVIEGETNYITVDRENVLETTFSELEYITNYRQTFQVDFMGEECVDQGGPHKEWIRLMNQSIKEKYFDHGLRPLLVQDYFFVGIMMAVALLQNGQLPVLVEESMLQQLVSSGDCSDPCVRQIRQGLEELGMLSALQQLPMLLYLLRP